MKKKILHLLASNSYSGAENVVCTIINNCSDKYEMYYCSPDGPIRETLKEKNINYISLSKLSVIEVRKIIDKHNIDVVHAHDFQASLIGYFLKTKVISHLHCNYNLLWCSFVVGKVYSFIQKKFDKIVVVSKEILDTAVFKKKIFNKTEIINNVIDNNMVIDKSMKFKTQKYDLVFVGRLITVKQPLLFIDIVKELSRDKPNIKACIIGDGELYNECLKRIHKYNLDTNIDLLGFKNNPFPYVKNSKVAVMTSSYEGLPLVAIESMILGTIVVNSGVGGLKSIFDKYPEYVCHEKRDYVTCIKKLLMVDKKDYKDDCDKMIKEFINMQEYKKKFEKIYEEILK